MMPAKKGGDVRVTVFFVSLLSVLPLFGKEDSMPDLKGKKVLLIVAANDFRDEEFFTPHELLKKSGAAVIVASSRKDLSCSVFGKTVIPDKLVADCQATDYDALVFVGGPGATEYFTNSAALNLARAAADNKKILAAICIAPVILANAGVLKDKKAVCFPSVAEQLKKQGASIGSPPVLQDGLLLTATGPDAAQAFAEALLKMLQ
jgi:protease I